MALLAADHLSKTFLPPGRRGHEVTAVDDVSLRLETGRTLAVVGESGAGKSTLGRMVLRLIEPTSGQVRFDDDDVLAWNAGRLRRFRTRAQMIFQDPYNSLDPRVAVGTSVAEPLLIHTDLSGAERRDRAHQALFEVGLTEEHAARLPAGLSGGQLQRIAIARALITGPDLIVCDEPTAALDASIQAEIVNLLTDLQERHRMSYLFITHNLALVDTMAHDVLVMRGGRTIEAGPTSNVLRRPQEEYTATLLAAAPRLSA